MQYQAIDKRTAELIEKSVISRALLLANSRPQRYASEQRWADRICKTMRVLPPDADWSLSKRGRLVRLDQNAANVRAVTQCQSQLISSLTIVAKGDAPDFGEAWYELPRKIGLNFGRVANVFAALSIAEGEISIDEQPPITPTMREFVAYAIAIMCQRPWNSRITKCDVCGKFELPPKRKGGPRPKTCSDNCTLKKGDPTAAERQRRRRARIRASQTPK